MRFSNPRSGIRQVLISSPDDYVLKFRSLKSCGHPNNTQKLVRKKTTQQNKILAIVALPFVILDKVKSMMRTLIPLVAMSWRVPLMKHCTCSSESHSWTRMLPQCRSRCSNISAASATARPATTCFKTVIAWKKCIRPLRNDTAARSTLIKAHPDRTSLTN